MESFLYAALEVFHPALYAAADISKEPIFLNKELRIPGRRRGEKIVDLLADIPLKTGEMTAVLLHTEVQAQNKGEPFHVRMFKYACVITLRLGRPFTALAIRTTHREKSEKIEYNTECFGARTVFTYLTVFIDQMDEKRLMDMKDNPVALAAVCAIRVLKAGKNETRRFEYARELFRLMKERGYSADTRARLVMFIDGITNLSAAELVKEFDKEIDELLEEVEDMQTMGPIMKRFIKRKSYEWGVAKGVAEGEARGVAEGEARGEARGIIEGKKATARLMLARGMEIDVIADLCGLSLEEVRELADSICPGAL